MLSCLSFIFRHAFLSPNFLYFENKNCVRSNLCFYSVNNDLFERISYYSYINIRSNVEERIFFPFPPNRWKKLFLINFLN